MPLFLAALLSFSQEPIRVTTQMVEVNVVVRGKNGPVTGLRAEDFILRDRGRIQKISVFRASAARPASAHPLAPGEFTNRLGDKESQHAVVIVWDHLNTEFEDAATARKQVFRALTEIPPGGRVGLYSLDANLHVIQDFTSDSTLLADALRGYRASIVPHSIDTIGGRPPSTGDQTGRTREGVVPMGAGMAALAAAAEGDAISVSAAYRAARTMAAVQAIANHLAGVHGRKSVIWLAGQYPPAAAALAYAGITIYPVDLMGVVTPMSLRGDVRPIPERTLVERTIARESGGIAFVDNDVRWEILQAVKDSQHSYTLGFYPDRPPDRTNALKIEVKRKGFEVGYRAAYSGIARPQGPEIPNALESPLDATQIALDVRLRRLGDGWDLALEIDPADLRFEPKNGRQTGGLKIVLRQLSNQGGDLATTSNDASFDLDPQQFLAFLSAKHAMSFVLPNPKAGLAALRLVVQDSVSGRVGSILVPIPR